MTIKNALQLGLIASTVTFSSISSAALSSYSQDLEGLSPSDPAALSNDGWLVGANVFDSTGTNFIYNYFAFPAPNVPGGGPAFSGVATGEGGAAQGNNQFNTYNDYNNSDHTNASGNRIEANIFRDIGVAGAGDAGTTWNFDFDVKLGNIGGATTATAFIKVLKTSDSSFALLDLQSIDISALAGGVWSSQQLSVLIDAAWVGETVQIGFTNTASNGDASGVFYDNLNFATASAVPVPAAAWLFGSAIAGLVAVRRKK